jgi:hypothetical protein
MQTRFGQIGFDRLHTCGAVDQYGHEPQHDPDSDQNAGNSILNGIAPGPWTREKGAGQCAKERRESMH